MRSITALLGFIVLFGSTSASAARYQHYPRYYDEYGMHFTAGVGLTFGGDSLSSVQFDNGDIANVNAGDAYHFYAGGLFHFYDSPIALRMTLGYLSGQASGWNGGATFDRTTFEVIPLFYLPHYSRLGVGFTHHMSPRLEDSYYGGGTADFKNANGLVFEYGYNVFYHSWIDLRYVNITYKAENPNDYPYPPDSVDGSHIGFYFSTEF